MTYSELLQAVQDITENNETSFVAMIPMFVRTSEDRILYSVDLNLFRKNVIGITTQSDPFLGTPGDYMSPIAMRCSGNTLLMKDVEFCQDYAKGKPSGVPEYFCQFDVTNIYLSPTPDDSYDLELHYRYRPESIVTAGTTWLGENAHSALLYGTLIEAYIFMKGEADVMGMYQQRFTEALMRLKNLGEGFEDTDQAREGLVRQRIT